VEARTVTAPDAITAFAVPNPNSASQQPSVFSGLVALWIAPPDRSPSLFGPALDLALTLSAVDVTNPNTEGEIVNARVWCKRKIFLCDYAPKNS
jgi:hypothetical protein